MRGEEMRVCKNGAPLYSYTNPSQHSFFISVFLRAGSMYEEPGECGITHFFEHATIRNINKMTDGKLYNILDSLGLEFNASTFSEMVQFYISGASEHFAKGAEFILKVLSPSVLTREDIDAERLRIKAEIREGDDKNSLSTFSTARVFEGTSLANSILGKNSDLDKINVRRLCDFRCRVVSLGNVFFYITGNVSEEQLDLFSNMTEAYPLSVGMPIRDTVAPVPASFGKRAPVLHIKNSDYTMVRFAFDMDMTRVKSECADLIYDILLTGYNSKIFIELSERRGLFYDTVGGVDRYKNIGSFYFSFEVKEQKLLLAVELVLEILGELRDKVLTAAECMRAGFVDNAFMLLDDARELNFTFAYDNHILGLGYKSLVERRAAYAAVTPDQIRTACREIFKAENLTLSIKGKKNRINENDILSLVNKYLG